MKKTVLVIEQSSLFRKVLKASLRNDFHVIDFESVSVVPVHIKNETIDSIIFGFSTFLPEALPFLKAKKIPYVIFSPIFKNTVSGEYGQQKMTIINNWDALLPSLEKMLQ